MCVWHLQRLSLLGSAVNDALAMETLLRKEHGFHTVCLLLNEDATKANIERALDAACHLLARDATGNLPGPSPSTVPHGRADHGDPPAMPTAAVGLGWSARAGAGSGWRAADGDGGTQRQEVFRQLLESVGAAGRFVFYFAGHGIKASGARVAWQVPAWAVCAGLSPPRRPSLPSECSVCTCTDQLRLCAMRTWGWWRALPLRSRPAGDRRSTARHTCAPLARTRPGPCPRASAWTSLRITPGGWGRCSSCTCSTAAIQVHPPPKAQQLPAASTVAAWGIHRPASCEGAVP